jgi:hypothetical protein
VLVYFTVFLVTGVTHEERRVIFARLRRVSHSGVTR